MNEVTVYTYNEAMKFIAEFGKDFTKIGENEGFKEGMLVSILSKRLQYNDEDNAVYLYMTLLNPGTNKTMEVRVCTANPLWSDNTSAKELANNLDISLEEAETRLQKVYT